MMIRRGVLLVLAGLLSLIPFAAGPAHAAGGSASGWRPFTQIGPSNSNVVLQAFTVTGANDAWSIWSQSRGPKWLEHWTGRAWRRLAVPARVTRLLGTSEAIGAASARELWVLAPGKAAHWNGKHWGIMKIPSWIGGDVPILPDFNMICDFGPSDVWVFFSDFGRPPTSGSFAARYDGHHWTKVRLPDLAYGATGFGPDNIWAAVGAPTKAQRFISLHWNGNSWAKIVAPRPSGVPVHYRATVGGFLATGPHDLWLRQEIAKGEGTERVDFLWHFNGHSWTRVRYGYSNDDIQAWGGDGHGGLWIADVAATRTGTRYLVHYNAGRWSRERVPVAKGTRIQQVLTINSIPGTQSAWAAGGVEPVGSGDVVFGEIWKFGP
jgi:hypothetical protein